MLPTYEDVMKYYTSVKNGFRMHAGGKEPRVSAICDVVTEEVEAIWMKASIPVVSHTRVLKLLRSYHDKYMKLLKPYKARHRQNKYKKQLNAFRMLAKVTLFDIAACKCDDDNNCKCEGNRKVSNEEKTFLRDQRTTRMMFIGTVDHITSRLLYRRQKRKELKRKREGNHSTCSKDCPVASKRVFSEADIEGPSESDSDDNIPLAKLKEKIQSEGKRRNTNKLTTIARACDRHCISDRAAAAIASAVLQDFVCISKADTCNVIGRNKIRRSRQMKRRASQRQADGENAKLVDSCQ
jgi:hypothetical protein